MKKSFDLETKECQAIRKEFGLAKSEWLRRLTPIELERLNMFPDNHTVGAANRWKESLLHGQRISYRNRQETR